MKTIAIIGGGFSGTLTAIRLLQKSKDIAVKIINDKLPLAKGVAYQTTDLQHLLNVPAGKMSAFKNEPNHFINWLKTKKEYAHYFNKKIETEFLPRMIYGEYLLFVISPYLENSQLEIIHSKAIEIKRNENAFSVRIKNSPTIEADKVVLAFGNFQPAPPKIADPSFFNSSNYFNNPWEDSYLKNLDSSKNILLIGTGLTMVDCVLSLKKIGFKGHIYITSPRGYMPASHEETVAYPDFYNEIENSDLAGILKTIRKHLKNAEAKHISWQSVIDTLRPYAQKIWIRFSQKEKLQFISHLRHIWGVARHRLPKETYKEVMVLKEKAQLEIIPGRITSITENLNSINVSIQSRKNKSTINLEVASVLNCTGPLINYLEIKDELIVDLISSNLIASNPLKMGIKATTDGKVLTEDNNISPGMFAIGSLLRGVLWETTAVPELSLQAESIAEQIIQTIQ